MPSIFSLIPMMFGSGGGGSGPSAADQQKQLDAAKMQQAQADAESKRKAILSSLANAQEQGGGALNPASLVDLASVIAGLPGEGKTGTGQKALADYLGTGPTTTGTSGESMVGATFGLSGTQG